MAEIQLRKGNKNAAVKLFESAFKQASREYSLLLGDMAERIAEIAAPHFPEVSEEYLNKAIESKKAFTMLDLPTFNKLGMLLRSRGEWEEALTIYRKALHIAPKDPALHYNTALAYHAGGK